MDDFEGMMPGMGGHMGGPHGRRGGMHGMGGRGPFNMPEEEKEKFRAMADTFDQVVRVGYNLFIGGIVVFVLRACYFVAPSVARLLLGVARRQRPSFEKAAFTAIAAVAVPITVAQAGLMLSGPLLPPIVGWKVYVYGSLVGGMAAVLLGVHALMHQAEPTLRKRATIASGAGAVVLILVLGSAPVVPSSSISRRGIPIINDITTSVDDPPVFKLLADANHTGTYPRRNMPLMREYYAHLVEEKLSFSPIGASLIRALSVAEELGWRVVTPIKYEDGHLALDEWMEKTEVHFEATCTSHSPLFRVPDEVIVRIRSRKLHPDDEYDGAHVDIRSRGHLPDDHGANAARVKAFLEKMSEGTGWYDPKKRTRSWSNQLDDDFWKTPVGEA